MAEIGRVTGGHVTRAAIRSALRSAGTRSLQVGFFKSARYPPVHTGKHGGRRQQAVPVAAVAAWNEFGTRGPRPIQERPFFRQGVERSMDGVREILMQEVDPKAMTVNEALGDTIGAYVAGQVQKRIVDLVDPGNADSTIARKGSSNPLIDTGKMKQSVTWRAKN